MPAAELGQPFDHPALAKRALEDHIRPGYARFADAARRVEASLSSDCAENRRKDIKETSAAFFDAVSAWGRIEHIQFGPIMESRRLERILFWPDRRGIGQRQIQKIVESRDETVLDPAQLAAKSVAIQGFSALEHLIFEVIPRDGRSDVPFACRYALAVARNVATIAAEVVEGWSDGAAYTASWRRAGQPDSMFVTATETTALLAKAYTQGLERLRDERVAGPLGYGKTRRPTPVLFEKSGRPMEILSANVDGLIHLFTVGGIRDAISATDARHEDINFEPNLDLIVRELKTAASAFSALKNARQPFADPARARMVAVGFPLRNANIQASALLTITAGITLGFNASDGD